MVYDAFHSKKGYALLMRTIMEGQKTIDSQQFPTANAYLIHISKTNHSPKTFNQQKIRFIQSK